jgi:hypothetical protein
MLGAMAATIRTGVNTAFYRQVVARIDASARARLDAATLRL